MSHLSDLLNGDSDPPEVLKTDVPVSTQPAEHGQPSFVELKQVLAAQLAKSEELFKNEQALRKEYALLQRKVNSIADVLLELEDIQPDESVLENILQHKPYLADVLELLPDGTIPRIKDQYELYKSLAFLSRDTLPETNPVSDSNWLKIHK